MTPGYFRKDALFPLSCERLTDSFDMIDRRSRERAIGDISFPFIRKIGSKIGHHTSSILYDCLGQMNPVPTDARYALQPIDVPTRDHCQPVGVEPSRGQAQSKIPQCRLKETRGGLEPAIVKPEKEDGHEHLAISQGKCGQNITSRCHTGKIADA